MKPWHSHRFLRYFLFTPNRYLQRIFLWACSLPSAPTVVHAVLVIRKCWGKGRPRWLHLERFECRDVCLAPLPYMPLRELCWCASSLLVLFLFFGVLSWRSWDVINRWQRRRMGDGQRKRRMPVVLLRSWWSDREAQAHLAWPGTINYTVLISLCRSTSAAIEYLRDGGQWIRGAIKLSSAIWRVNWVIRKEEVTQTCPSVD